MNILWIKYIPVSQSLRITYKHKWVQNFLPLFFLFLCSSLPLPSPLFSSLLFSSPFLSSTTLSSLFIPSLSLSITHAAHGTKCKRKKEYTLINMSLLHPCYTAASELSTKAANIVRFLCIFIRHLCIFRYVWIIYWVSHYRVGKIKVLKELNDKLQGYVES